eukprot:1687824-Pyramimonas_sp.AAC.1
MEANFWSMTAGSSGGGVSLAQGGFLGGTDGPLRLKSSTTLLHLAHLPPLAMIRKLNAQLPHCLHHEKGCGRPMTRKCAVRARAEENPLARKAFL